MSGTSYELPFDHGEPVPGPQPAPETDHALMDDLGAFNQNAPDQDEELAVPITRDTREAAPDPEPAPAMVTPEAEFERAGESLGVSPEAMEALTPDPVVDRLGVDVDTLYALAEGTKVDGVNVPPEWIDEETVAEMERVGVHGPDAVRQYLGDMARTRARALDHQADKEQLRANTEALEELRNTGPASPLDNRLARIEAMLSERQERDAVLEQMERDDARRTALHGGALDQLARVASHMGVEAPSGEAVAAWYAENDAWNMNPNTAARMCFTDLGAGEVVGVKATRRTQRVVRPGAAQQRLVDGEEEYARGPFVVPGGASSQGQAYRPRVEDILADDDGDDGRMRIWGGR